jgi:DNA polymerase/3'-5' exonuclease PolX
MLQQEGVEGLRKVPGLGESLTRTIHDLVVTGRLSRLDRLWGEMDPVLRFASVPGIGTVLVEHLHCDLGLPRSKRWRRRPTTAAWPRSPGWGRSSWQGS